MSTLMRAPPGFAGTVLCQSGNSYTPNVAGRISVAATDVNDCENAGFVPLGTFGMNLTLVHGRNADGSVLAAAAASGKFGISSAVGTSLGLAGEAAQNNTKTDDVLFEVTLPESYMASSNITATVNALVAGSGTAGTKTLTVKAYRLANDGTQGANLGPAAKTLTTGAADYACTITGTTLSPSDRLLIEIETAIQETGNAATINAQINSLRLA